MSVRDAIDGDRYDATEGALEKGVTELAPADRFVSNAERDDFVQSLMSRYDDACER
ncbi:hypothetical protein [Luteimicrobium sp. DT211]|uniref:hypothetical protein n=1 Tax=Luteimicrobium sp. DT211 TaxID=3393412 RepID=UPI003CF0A71C